MASLNEQMDGMLGSSYVDDTNAPMPSAFEKMQRRLDTSDKTNTEMFTDKDDADEKLQSTVTGMAVGSAAIPSDTITMASEAANFVKKNPILSAGFPKTAFVAPYLEEVNKLAGRPGFEELIKALGIKSDPTNTSQIVGEILSPSFYFPAFKGAVKLSKAAGKAFDDLGDIFKGGDGTGGAKFAPEGPSASSVNKTPQIDDFNKPQINLNEIGLNTAAGKKGYTDYIGVETEAMGGTYTPERYRKLSLTEKDRLYKETGVYRGSDGKVRYKISTADAQLEIGTLNKYSIIEGGKNIVPSFNAKNIPSEGLTLKEVLNHADLYKQYPDDIANATKRTEYTKSVQYGLIENIKVKNFDTYIKEKNLNFEEAMAELKNTQAIYSRSEGAETIYLRSGKLSDVRSSILHEVQHAIQHREGFAAGSSPQKFLFDSKTDFGKTYLDNQENIRIAKNEAEYDFIKTTDKNGFRINFIENKDLFESVTDKLVKREFNKFTGNSRFLAKENMLVEDRLKETFRGSGVYDKQPVIYQGYDTRNVLFNNAEMNLANSLADNTSFQDYIRQRITIEQTVKDQKLMEAEAHKMYASEIGEVQARKIQEDDLRYKEIVQQLRDNNKLKPNEEPNAILKERIFRSMNPSEKNVLQGQKNISVDKSA